MKRGERSVPETESVFRKKESPMRCLRCQGTIVEEWIFTEREGGAAMARCVNCGDLIDPVVISNRDRSSSPFFKDAEGMTRRLREV